MPHMRASKSRNLFCFNIIEATFIVRCRVTPDGKEVYFSYDRYACKGTNPGGRGRLPFTYRTCSSCHKKVDKKELYKIEGQRAFCSEECADGFQDIQDMKHICSIVKHHDEELAYDDQKIDIKKFLRVALECGGNEQEGRETISKAGI